MSDTFRPNPFGAVLVSAVILGIGNAFLVLVPTVAASFLVPHARLGLGTVLAFAFMTGLVTSVTIALADRPMTYVKQTDHPYGVGVALAHLLAPILVGAVAGWLICGAQWFTIGAACAFLAYLVQFFLLTPWKKTVDEEDMKARTREFGKVTHQYAEEYKADIRELTRQKAQRKHEKNQKRLRKKRERR